MSRIRSPLHAFFRLCALAAIPAAAQGIWSIQRPLPTNNSLYAIKAIDKDLVLACGTMGQIFRTMDGGATWREVASGTAFKLRGLSAGAGVRDHVFAVGDSGTILSTLDGGLTWKPQASGTKAALNAVSAVDAKTAYACGASGTLLKTTDGGATWAPLASGTNLTFRAISAADAQVVYAASTKDTLYRSSDGGATWKGYFLGPIEGMGVNGSGLYGVSAVNRDTVFVSALDVHNSIPKGWVYRTVDGGSNWTRIDSTGGITYAISAVSGRTAFVSGFADMHATQDAGATWTTRSSPKVSAGYVQSNDAVSAVDAQTAFATGSFGMILATADGGQTWAPRPGPQPGVQLYAIRSVGASLAFASGGDWTFLKTTDGVNWKSIPMDNKFWIQGFDTRDGALILAAAGNAILRSTDGGATWTPKNIPGIAANALTVVALADAQTAFAAGRSGTVIKTSDAGVTWSILPSRTTRDINALQALSPIHAFAACDSGLMLRTMDGGGTWDSLPTGTRNNLLSLHFLNPSAGYLSGNKGTLKKTRDGGATWDSLPPPNWWDPVYAVRALDEKTAYIAGYGGRILKTADGGTTWTRETSRTTSTMRSISIVDGTTAYAAGEFGTIVKYSGQSAPIRPSGPWGSSLALRYLGGRLYADLPAAGPVSGRILTFQGRTLSILDFGPLEAGPHALPIPSRSGGPYLLDLRYGGARWPLLLPRER